MGWGGRNTFYNILQTDIINNEIYYLQKGIEVMDNQSTNVFQCFWLRKDLNGNIIAGAYDPTNEGLIGSATILDPVYLFFPNGFLNLKYSQTYVDGESTSTDSVVSVSATVGTYTNCLQIRTIKKLKGHVERISDAYYAYHFGTVKDEIIYPADEAHADNLVDFSFVNCSSSSIEDGFANENELDVYPNPAADMVTLQISNLNNEDLKLEIYTDLGELVRSNMLKQNNRQFYIGDLCNGIYIVYVQSTQRSMKQKLIIQR